MQNVLDRLVAAVDPSLAAMVSAALLGWVAVVYLIMGFGVRSAELVWAGRHVSRLPAEKRVWSVLYGLGLLASGLVLLDLSGTIGTGLVPSGFATSAEFVVLAFLGVSTAFALFVGSTWERMLFAPITLLGAGLAGWLIFA